MWQILNENPNRGLIFFQKSDTQKGTSAVKLQSDRSPRSEGVQRTDLGMLQV